MDKTLQTRGQNSMLYISFGSVFWAQPEKIWALLDTVMEKEIPFIFSHASPFAMIPEEIATKVREYGLGLLSKWSPQQNILAHPVTGWFLTHCGQNSFVESVTMGVPMICWPFQADQGSNAAHISGNLDIGYELFEIRSGPGLLPVYRLGRAPVGTVDAVRAEAAATLDKAFGEDGKRKRANVKKLQESVLSAWSADGPSTRELQIMADSLAA